jgi:Tfp pilus assembly protein PilO
MTPRMMTIDARHARRAARRRWLRRALVAGVVYGLTLAVYSIVVHEPGVLDLHRRERDASELERTLQQARAGAEALDELRQATAELELEHRKLDRILPTQLTEPASLEWLFGPAEMVQSRSVDVEDGEIQDRDFYREQPIHLRFAIADLERLKAFVREIERPSPIRRVTAVGLENRGRDALDVRVTVVGYAWPKAPVAE